MPDARPKKSFARRVASSFLYMGVGNVISKIVGAVALFYTLSLVTPADLGLASLVLAVIAILSAVTELGLGVALVQAQNPTRNQIDSLFWLSLMVSTGFYALVFVAAPLVSWFYEDGRLTALLQVQGLNLVVFSLFLVSRTMMQRDLQFGRLSLIENTALLLASASMVLLAWRGYGVWAFVLAEVVNRSVQALACQACRPYVPRLRFRLDDIRKMVGFGLYATGSRLLYNFYTNIDYLIVGKVFSGEVLGIYTLAYRIVSDPVRALAVIVNRVAYPAFARLQDDIERLRRYFFTVARISMTLIGTLFMILVVYLDQLLLVFDYHQWMKAVPLVYVFAFLGLIRSVAPLVPQLLNAVGRARLNFIYALSCSVLMPIAFLVGSAFSITGVAVAWLVAYPIVVTILFHFGSRAVMMGLVGFVARTMAGLRIVVPVALCALGLRLLLLNVLAASGPVVVVVGISTTLLLGLGVAYLRERETIRRVFLSSRS
jgi:O-antigen/teichoic acid export membrane protein